MSNQEIEMALVPAEVVTVLEREGIDEQSGRSLIASFGPFHTQICQALETSKSVTDGESVAMQRVARSCRLELRKIRCEVENVRKNSKASALKYGKAVDGLANVLKFLCEPEEKRLEDIERYAERKEAERIAQLVADRSRTLTAVDGNPEAYNLASMDEETFTATVETARRIRGEKIETARRLEAERVARERAEAEERERIRQENAKLRAEAAKREREIAAERAAAEDERQRIEAERARERREHEAKARAEAAMAEVVRRREADIKHRTEIMDKAIQDIEKKGVDFFTAAVIVEAIADNRIRNVRIVW